MEYFDYKTRHRESGKILRGITTGDDLESAAEALKLRGEDILEIGPIEDFMGIRRRIYSISLKTGKKVKLELLAMLKFMLESGMSLYSALVNIRDSSSQRQLRNICRILADEVRKGASLSSSMQRSGYFDEATVMQLKAGEESGNINDAITRIIAQREREMEFSGKIKSAMMYPAIICVVMVAVLWVMMTLVVPSLAETLVSMGGELPLITKIVLGTANAMKTGTPYAIAAVLAGIITYRVLMKRNPSFKMRVDTLKLKLPVIGNMLERIELSRFCRNLSAMLESGITLVTSIRIVKSAIKNAYIKRGVEDAGRLIELSGMNLSTALSKSGSFPEMMLGLIDVGISSGQICKVLDRISGQYEKEVDTLLKRITSMIEPILIVVVGLVAGTVVISLFLPMFAIMDTF